MDDATAEARKAFDRVLELGTKIEWEHWLLYYTRASWSSYSLRTSPWTELNTPLLCLCLDYELGRLLACKGDKAAARGHLDLVASGKHLEASTSARKGKYSMEVRFSLCIRISHCRIDDRFLQNALHVRTNAALEALDHGRSL